MYIIDMDAHPPMGEVDVSYVGKMDSARFFHRLMSIGIDKACGTLTVSDEFFTKYSEAEAASRINHAAMELAVRNDKYIPSIRLYNGMETEKLEAYFSLGAVTAEADAKTIDINSEILECAQNLGVFIKLRNENPDFINALAEKYPALKVSAFGRTGKYTVPASIYEIIKKRPNVYINMSGAVWTFNYVVHEWAEKMQDNMLFGTAYPNTASAAKLAAVKWELRDCAESIQTKVFAGNASKFIGR